MMLLAILTASALGVENANGGYSRAHLSVSDSGESRKDSGFYHRGDQVYDSVSVESLMEGTYNSENARSTCSIPVAHGASKCPVVNPFENPVETMSSYSVYAGEDSGGSDGVDAPDGADRDGEGWQSCVCEDEADLSERMSRTRQGVFVEVRTADQMLARQVEEDGLDLPAAERFAALDF